MSKFRLAGLFLCLFATSGCSEPDPKPDAAIPSSGYKWHPGHYLNAYWGKNIAVQIRQAKSSPAFKGISVIHGWWELEKDKDQYDFSAIDRELDAVQSAGLQLIIQVADRSFKDQDCAPAYLRTPAFGEGQSRIHKKCTVLRHNPAVQDRLIALYRALGQRFDSHPNFEALMLEEDSMEKKGTNMDGYSDRAYIDQSKRGMNALAQSFPHTVVFKWLNWGPGIPELFAHALSLGIGVGAPDLDPKMKSWAYPAPWQQYAHKIPLEMSVQDPRVQKTVLNGSDVRAIFEFGTSDPPSGLALNYMVWDQPEKPGVISFQKDIKPYIVQRDGFIQRACPTALASRGGCR